MRWHELEVAWLHTRRNRVLTGLMVLAMAVGIVGLTSFRVTQRNKQIGIRRALGATRCDVLRYFQLENALIVTLGIAVGALLAYGLSLMLMRLYELPALPPGYLLIGAALLWGLGQLAVLVPALRAASVPPALAIRGL